MTIAERFFAGQDMRQPFGQQAGTPESDYAGQGEDPHHVVRAQQHVEDEPGDAPEKACAEHEHRQGHAADAQEAQHAADQAEMRPMPSGVVSGLHVNVVVHVHVMIHVDAQIVVHVDAVLAERHSGRHEHDVQERCDHGQREDQVLPFKKLHRSALPMRKVMKRPI